MTDNENTVVLKRTVGVLVNVILPPMGHFIQGRIRDGIGWILVFMVFAPISIGLLLIDSPVLAIFPFGLAWVTCLLDATRV